MNSRGGLIGGIGWTNRGMEWCNFTRISVKCRCQTIIRQYLKPLILSIHEIEQKWHWQLFTKIPLLVPLLVNCLVVYFRFLLNSMYINYTSCGNHLSKKNKRKVWIETVTCILPVTKIVRFPPIIIHRIMKALLFQSDHIMTFRITP